MKIVSGLLAQNKQQFNLTLDDGSVVAVYLEYISQQLGWFFDVAWGESFAQNGIRLTNAPNLLRQYRNQIPFGIGVLSGGNAEPTTLESLSDGTTTVYLLNQTDVARIEFEFFGGPVVPVEPVAISADGTASPILTDSWGPAGGDLSASYPNPFVVAAHFSGTRLPFGAVSDGQFLKRVGSQIVGASAVGTGDVNGPSSAVDGDIAVFSGVTGKLLKDAPSTPVTQVPSAGEKQALVGTLGAPSNTNKYVTDSDSRNSNSRTPTSHATTHQPGGSDAMAVDAVAGTGSLRTIGTGAQQACAGNDTRLSDSRAPTGAAGGALGGTYPNPTITALPTGGSIYSYLQKQSATNYDTRWRRPDFVNICDYPGVDPTGATDSTAGLLAAKADVAFNYGCFYLPPGQYKTKSGINFTGYSNLLILGAGAELFADCGTFVVSSLTHVTTAATLTTASPHGLSTGQSMTVRGAVQAPYNGSFTITVTGASTFTYVMGSDPGANATGTLKTCINVQTMVIDETSSRVRVEGLHFNSNANTRGDGIHLRVNASEFTAYSCLFEQSSGFGAFAGESVTAYQTNVTFDTCTFLNTWGDGLHAGGVNGLDVDGCTFDGTGDDSIGIIGYEAYANVVKNVSITNCIVRNMQNAGFASGAGMRIALVDGFTITGNTFNNIAGPCVRICAADGSHPGVYNSNGLVSDLNATGSTGSGVEAYFLYDVDFANIRVKNAPALQIASWLYGVTAKDLHTTAHGVNCITVYVPPQSSFAGRSFDAHWGDLIVQGCTGYSDIGDNANCVLYMDTNAGCDIEYLVVAGNNGTLQNGGGAWIVYKGIKAGGDGKIVNNTNIGNTTVTCAGGTVASVVTNNN